jgi:hypothetical protein
MLTDRYSQILKRPEVLSGTNPFYFYFNITLLFWNYLLLLAVLGMEPLALCVLGNHSTTE